MPQTQPSNGTEQPVTSAQLAAHLQITTRTLATYRAQRKVPYWKLNARNFRYRISDVEKALMK
jgi:predicted site-specific integrase-resolvase